MTERRIRDNIAMYRAHPLRLLAVLAILGSALAAGWVLFGPVYAPLGLGLGMFAADLFVKRLVSRDGTPLS